MFTTFIHQNRFVVNSLNIRLPADWNIFLTNDENKTTLIYLLLDHWSSQEMVGAILIRPFNFVEVGQAFRVETVSWWSHLKTTYP